MGDLKRCPKCGENYRGHPALSRFGGEYICPDCGVREALTVAGMCMEEQEEVIREIYQLNGFVKESESKPNGG